MSEKAIVKLSPFSIVSFVVTTLLTAELIAGETPPEIEPLDEEFLEFIANMSEIDGQTIDTLDMLEIVDNDMKSNTLDDDFKQPKLLEKNRESSENDSAIKEKQP